MYKMIWQSLLDDLAASGNLRSIPSHDSGVGVVDLSTNDYLGIASRRDLHESFLAGEQAARASFSSSASRLLAARQESYTRLERRLGELFGGREALLFNSGYHANTGIVSALAGAVKGCVIIADKLIHASVIDGITLSGASFERFRHNDLRHLERLLTKHSAAPLLIVIVEGVYSMDGDSADIHALVELKKRFPNMMLYVDEAHSFGVEGPGGLGLCVEAGKTDEVDIIVGTFGKSLASSGAFAIVSKELRDFLINKSRPLIFSTALPPICVEWTLTVIELMLSMDTERTHLRQLARRLKRILVPLSESAPSGASHIQPLIIGDAEKAVALSKSLLEDGIKVLPIRTPTVPPGTERLRISLSAALADEDLTRLAAALNKNFRS